MVRRKRERANLYSGDSETIDWRLRIPGSRTDLGSKSELLDADELVEGDRR
jgi:hypothetical protein